MGISSLFPFKKSSPRNPQKPNPDASYLIASILVVYPEVAKVSYDLSDELLQLSFAIDGNLPEDSYQTFAAQSIESIRTYHALSGFSDARLELSLEVVAGVSFLQIRRDMATLTRGELNIIASIVNDIFADNLIVENDERDDEEISAMQEEKLDQIFGRLRQNKISDCLVGIRENEKVIVYVR